MVVMTLQVGLLTLASHACQHSIWTLEHALAPVHQNRQEIVLRLKPKLFAHHRHPIAISITLIKSSGIISLFLTPTPTTSNLCSSGVLAAIALAI